ncbi:hypothetical protein MIR68_001949 [Amoeboaphelidium protococcarum]|nr:hypothetical protein MIR68_001949 [Amoeboaphelidium protococcarum]
MSAKLQANRVHLDEEAGVWQFVESPNATLGDIQIVKKPTASAMMHLVLNPFIYRSLQPIDSLDALAAIVGAPSNWLDILIYELASDDDMTAANLLVTFYTPQYSGVSYMSPLQHDLYAAL